MNIYSYVAAANPYHAKAILHKYGYKATNIKNSEDLGICLQKLVVAEGEAALQDIIDGHPDREIIVEQFSVKQKDDYKNYSGDCPCRHREQYWNFDARSDKPSSVTKETNVFILAAALILAAAIIVKK